MLSITTTVTVRCQSMNGIAGCCFDARMICTNPYEQRSSRFQVPFHRICPHIKGHLGKINAQFCAGHLGAHTLSSLTAHWQFGGVTMTYHAAL